MLSLSRYPEQSLFIFDKDGNPLSEVRINSNKGSQISVGIQAPREISIIREELIEADRLAEIRRLLK